MARAKFLLPFGGGLDRKTGSAVVDPDAFGDLRNVYLYRGRMELRRGQERSLDIGWGTDIIGIFSIRAQGLAAIVVYDDVSRDVRLYAVDDSLGTASLVDTLFTLPAGALEPPVVLGVDMYNSLVLAHDEADYTLRQVTQVLNTVALTVADYTADLDRDGSADPVKFRGVARHLNYLLAWGYGHDSDPDRPEVLRISLPGQPTVMVPEHYFLVGSPGDPIIGGGKVGGVFGIYKAAEAYRLNGYDRQTFGVVPMDDSFGLLSSRLHVTVVNDSYRWTLEGPRVSSGGPSADLEMPLDLGGPSVNPFQDGDSAFAFHDRTEKEVLFVFGNFAYVLHLRDGARRWSYRPYPFAMRAAGVMYQGGSASLSLAVAEVDTTSYVDPVFSLVDPPLTTEPRITVNWTMTGVLIGGEEVEVWTRSQYGADPWTLRGTFPEAAGTATVYVPHFHANTDVAIRTVLGGTPGAGYTSAPDTWPAVSRTTQLTGGDVDVFAFAIGSAFTRVSAVAVQRILNYAGPGINGGHPEISWEVEKDGGGGFVAATLVNPSNSTKGIEHPNADVGTQWTYRIRAIGPHGASGWTNSGAVWLRPAAPFNVQIQATPPPKVPFNPHEHDMSADYGADLGTIQFRAAHVNGGVGAYSPTQEVTHPAAGSATVTGVPDHGSGRPQDVQGEARTKLTAFGVDDFSEWIVAFLGVAEP